MNERDESLQPRGLGWDGDGVESLMSERDESLRPHGLGWDGNGRCGLG